MPETIKYYYLKLKDNFFDSEEIKILDSMQNGKDYQILYLKLCLLSLKSDGALMFKNMLPYDVSMLSTVTNTNIDTVKTGIEIFSKIGLITITDSGVIFMSEIQSLIGKSSNEAERQKKFRDRIKQKNNESSTNVITKVTKMPENVTNVTTNVEQLLNSSTPEIEIKIERELKKDINSSDEPFPDDPPEPKLPEQAVTLARLLFSLQKEKDPGYNVTEPNITKWADAIDKLNRIDGRSWQDIESVLRWCKADSFWCSNIMSGEKLRKQYSQLFSKMKTRPENKNNYQMQKDKEEYLL